MMNDYKAERAGEVRQLLNYIRDNPAVRYPAGWCEAVRAEAVELGLIEQSALIGCNCRPDIDRGIVYGGDREDVF